MGDVKDLLPADFETFQKDADFLWNSILTGASKSGSDKEKHQNEFMDALERSIAYLNGLKMAEIKAMCLKGDMAEKISMIIDLKDYVYNSIIDELADSFTDH